jgi:hypothetical protein
MTEKNNSIESTGALARWERQNPPELKGQVLSNARRDTGRLKKELLGESFVRSNAQEIVALKASTGYQALDSSIQMTIDTALTNPSILNTRAVQVALDENGLRQYAGSQKAGKYDGLFWPKVFAGIKAWAETMEKAKSGPLETTLWTSDAKWTESLNTPVLEKFITKQEIKFGSITIPKGTLLEKSTDSSWYIYRDTGWSEIHISSDKEDISGKLEKKNSTRASLPAGGASGIAPLT